MIATTDPLTAARAAALFLSDLSASAHPTAADADAAIRHALRVHGGSRGCAAGVAAEYGDHPELAVPRMRWARDVVDALYARRAPSRVCVAPVSGRRPLPAAAPAAVPARPAVPTAAPARLAVAA
jgi:hypothetical protein